MRMLIQRSERVKADPKDYILFLLILLRYVIPPFFSEAVEEIRYLDLLLTGVSFVAMGWLFIRCKKVFTISILLFALMCISLVFSTVLNRGEILTALIHAVEIGLLCLVVNAVLYDEKKAVAFLLVVRDVAGAFALLNLVLMAVVPMGIPVFTTEAEFPYFLYGNVNSTIKSILPGLCCAVLVDSKYRKSISFATVALLLNVPFMAVSVYFTATAVLGEMFVLCWILFRPLLNKRARIFYVLVLAFVVFVEIAVVINFETSALPPLIAKILHKPPTFSNRSELWSKTRLQITYAPLLGHGLQNGNILARATGNFYGSHNYYLDILYQRGVVGLSFLALIVLLPLWKFWKHVELSHTTYILMGFCCSCLIMFLAEPFFTSENMVLPMFYAFVTLAYRDAGGRAWEWKWRGEKLIALLQNNRIYRYIDGRKGRSSHE